MLTYRDKRTGRVTDMDEASDVKRRFADEIRSVGDRRQAENLEERSVREQAQARNTLEKMDEADRWERMSDSREIEEARRSYARRKALRRGLPDPHPNVAESPPQDEDDDEGDGRPSQGDPKAVWIDYRVSQGVDRDDAESMTKADLVDYDQEG